MNHIIGFTILLLCLKPAYAQNDSLPEGFVYIKDVLPDIVLDMRYAGSNNFIGKPIEGYLQPKAIISLRAAEALLNVHKELKESGLCLKVFDAYRPQRAVNHFIEWARNKEDTLMKTQFYPEVDKKDLFNLGYISTRSGHSRGSTIDLTLVDANTGKELDMGGSYDFFDEISHHNATAISSEQKQNRNILKNTMMKYGFVPYSQEWWHYTFQPEPFPETYFDFEVK